MSTPEAAVYSILDLIDAEATDLLKECLAEGGEIVPNDLYPGSLNRPVRLVDVIDNGDTARVLWEATAHKRLSHQGREFLPGQYVPISSRLTRIDGLWKLVKLHE